MKCNRYFVLAFLAVACGSGRESLGELMDVGDGPNQRMIMNEVMRPMMRAVDNADIEIAVIKRIRGAMPHVRVRKGDGYLYEIDVPNFRNVINRFSLWEVGVVELIRGRLAKSETIYIPNVWPQPLRDGVSAYVPYFSPTVDSEWLVFLESPFEETTTRQKRSMERFREVNGETFLGLQNFFLHWRPPMYPQDSEVIICLHWPHEKVPKGMAIATKQLPDELKAILAVIEDEDRTIEDEFDELNEKLTDPYAKLLLERLRDRARAKEKSGASSRMTNHRAASVMPAHADAAPRLVVNTTRGSETADTVSAL